MDSLTGFLGGNEAPLFGGFHSLLKDAARCGINLNFRFAGNKWIDALDLAHTLNLADLPGERKLESGTIRSDGHSQEDHTGPERLERRRAFYDLPDRDARAGAR